MSEQNEQHEHHEQQDPGMDAFEQQLARAMRRVEVRAETTAKLLALADEAEQSRRAQGGGLRLVRLSNGGKVIALPPRPSAWIAGAVAAALAVGIWTGVAVHREHERAAAERQFEAAIAVTDHALDHTREQLQRAGLKIGQ